MYNAFRGRVNASGANIQEAMLKVSMRQAFDYILSSPSLSTVYLNKDFDTPYPAIVSNIESVRMSRVLFLPNTVINVGDYVHHDSDIYLAVDRTTDELYPQLIVELCNDVFVLQVEGTRVIVGYDDFNRPIYNNTESSIYEIPCVLSTKITSTIDNTIISLPSGEVIIKIPYSPDKIPKLNYQFTHRNMQYKVVSVSYENIINEIGYLELRLQNET